MKELNKKLESDRYDIQDYYIVIVFPDYASRLRFVDFFGFNPENQYIDGQALQTILIDLLEGKA